jgi:hypothetical protein
MELMAEGTKPQTADPSLSANELLWDYSSSDPRYCEVYLGFCDVNLSVVYIYIFMFMHKFAV